jgi:zinc protease
MPLRRRPAIFRLEREEVDDVPVYWAEAPAPFVVGVIFRVGRSDETLATAGVTHLVEHLAIPPRQPANVELNGTVTGTETMFWAAGRREDALAAFAGILEGLAELPLQRLEAERQILLTEAASASSDPVQDAAAFRFGARGHGLAAYGEFGLYRLDALEVERWWRKHFGARNAALWMTGRPPRRFRIPLQAGERHPVRTLEPIADLRFPAHNTEGASGGVSAAFLLERSFAANVALGIAEERLRQRLRFERGLSYGVHAVYDRLARGHAHGVLWADCLDSRARLVRDEFLSILRGLADEGPTREELREQTESLRQAVSEPASAGTFTYGFASDELSGDRVLSLAELVEGRAAVRPEDAAGVLAAALRMLLLITPAAADGLVDGFERYPLTSTKRVAGRIHRPRGLSIRGERRKARLLLAPDGISVVSPRDEAVTVLFSECCAVLRWVGGRRVLWSEDGFSLEVDPEFWKDGSEIVRRIDAAIADDLVIPMERELEELSAAVDSAAGDSLRGRFMSKDELAALPHLLREGEDPLVVAQASQGIRAGLVAVTEERVLFLYFDEVKVELPLEEVTAVRAVPKSFWHDNKLIVESGSGGDRFTDIRPRDRLEELASAIRERAPSVD